MLLSTELFNININDHFKQCQHIQKTAGLQYCIETMPDIRVSQYILILLYQMDCVIMISN